MKNSLSGQNAANGFCTGTDTSFSTVQNYFFSAKIRLSTGLWMTVLPLFLIVAAILIEYSGFDLWWEGLFFDRLNNFWPYRDHWLFEQVIHEGGRLFNIFTAGIWLVAFGVTFFHRPYKKYQKPLLYFIAAAASGPLIVGILKQTTHIYTPWDIRIFSGHFPYIRLFDSVPSGLPAGEAFPSGHASGGYAFFSLYFLLHHLGSPHKKYGFFAGLFIGGIYGIGQQFRGAHFPSHDLFSMVICWYSAFFMYYLFYPNQWRALFND